MARETIKECNLNCIKCKVKYDLVKLSLKVKHKKGRNLYCPCCGFKVGTLN